MENESRENIYGQPINEKLPTDLKKLPSKIMYIENKTNYLDYPGRIGRVYFSRTKRTVYYGGRVLRSIGGRGFKANYIDIKSGEEFWISGPRKDRNDRLYGGCKGVKIDKDVKEEYFKVVKK